MKIQTSTQVNTPAPTAKKSSEIPHVPSDTYHKNLLAYDGGALVVVTALGFATHAFLGDLGTAAVVVGAGLGAFSGCADGFLDEYSNGSPNASKITPTDKQSGLGAVLGAASTVGGLALGSLCQFPMVGLVVGATAGIIGAAAIDTAFLDESK